MSALSDATNDKPFSNGTEGDAWMDHSMHGPTPTGAGSCDLILFAMMPDFPSDEFPWPEAWLPEPDDGRFFLPSRLVCGMFAPCEKDGCTGDPGADERAERMAEVGAYWSERR